MSLIFTHQPTGSSRGWRVRRQKSSRRPNVLSAQARQVTLTDGGRALTADIALWACPFWLRSVTLSTAFACIDASGQDGRVLVAGASSSR